MAAQIANSAARLSIESGYRQQRWLCAAVRVLQIGVSNHVVTLIALMLLSCSPESSRRLKENVLPRAFRRHSGVP